MKSYKIAPLQILPATGLLFLDRFTESVEQGSCRLDRFPADLVDSPADLPGPLLEHGELGSLDELVKGRVLRPADPFLRRRRVSASAPRLWELEGRPELAVRVLPAGLLGLVALVRGRSRRKRGQTLGEASEQPVGLGTQVDA